MSLTESILFPIASCRPLTRCRLPDCSSHRIFAALFDALFFRQVRRNLATTTSLYYNVADKPFFGLTHNLVGSSLLYINFIDHEFCLNPDRLAFHNKSPTFYCLWPLFSFGQCLILVLHPRGILFAALNCTTLLSDIFDFSVHAKHPSQLVSTHSMIAAHCVSSNIRTDAKSSPVATK